MWRPDGGASRLTWRRLKVLIEGLPGESLTKTAIRDAMSEDEFDQVLRNPPAGYGPWSHEALRLANIEDLLKWLIFAVYAAQGAKPKKPDPTPRPGVRRKKRVGAEQIAHLRRLQAEHEALHGDTGGRLIPLPAATSEAG